MDVWHLAEPQKDRRMDRKKEEWIDGWMDGAPGSWKVGLIYLCTPVGHHGALTYKTHLINIFE